MFMEFTIPARTLKAVLKLMATVALRKKQDLDILKCVEITATETGTIVFRATNLDVEITQTCVGEVFYPGVAVVDVCRMRAAVTFRSGRTTVKCGSEIVVVSCAGIYNGIPIPPGIVDDFPAPTQCVRDHHFYMATDALRDMFKAPALCVAPEETRDYLNGVHLTYVAEDKALHCVATDGHRLGLFKVPAPEGAAGIPGIIVPIKTVGLITKLTGVGPAKIEVGDMSIRIVSGDTMITSKLIDEKFPDYIRIMPVFSENKMIARVKDFMEPLARLIKTAKFSSPIVLLGITHFKVAITMLDSELEENPCIDILAQSNWGPGVIGVKARYLLGILHSLPSEEFVLRFSTPHDPVIIEGVGVYNLTYVIMPIRV